VLVRIEVQDPDVELTRSLRAWLEDDPDTRPLGPIRTAGQVEPEKLGSVLTVLELAIPSAISAGQLIVAILNWRRSARPAKVTPVIVLSHGDATVLVDRDDLDPKALARELAGEPP
jgi:Effector Associated Constant Component 1